MKNTEGKGSIRHEGTVLKIGRKSVVICISSVSACAGCQAEGYCSMADKEDKIIEVTGDYNVREGDRVTVLMERSMGYSALFLGYLLPLILIVLTLIVSVSFNVPELPAGLLSIGIIIPYYVILFLFRNRINKKFTFSLKQ
jgi:sigma-E factor negative regulatory protein RseC